MDLVTNVLLFFFGVLIGHVGPRLPTLFITRAKGFNLHFPPHPQPVPLSPHLTQRVLHLRTYYWSSFLLAGFVMFFGGLCLRWGSASFGFGLWMAASWLMLSRVQNLLAGRPAPWTHDLAVELQIVMNASQQGKACCSTPAPQWESQCVRCQSCSAVLARIARPDLGRPRQDGRLLGMIRLLISDGYPLAQVLEEPVENDMGLPAEQALNNDLEEPVDQELKDELAKPVNKESNEDLEGPVDQELKDELEKPVDNDMAVSLDGSSED